jgi:hypothetical protein
LRGNQRGDEAGDGERGAGGAALEKGAAVHEKKGAGGLWFFRQEENLAAPIRGDR